MVDKIVVSNPSTGAVGNFRYGSWMNPWGSSTVSLSAQVRGEDEGRAW